MRWDFLSTSLSSFYELAYLKMDTSILLMALRVLLCMYSSKNKVQELV